VASDDREREGYLLLSLLQARTGGSVLRRLPDGEVGRLLEWPGPELARAMGLGDKAADALVALKQDFDAEALLGRLDRAGFRALTYGDGSYPKRLKLAPDPPPALFVDGGLRDEGCVAIVGSRRATRSGLETAGLLARALVGRGICVVSGLAAGVDAAAHEGALAAGGRTVGVLGCGIDVTYP
jgi:DNA processing protein